jgi:hypothetical protein
VIALVSCLRRWRENSFSSISVSAASMSSRQTCRHSSSGVRTCRAALILLLSFLIGGRAGGRPSGTASNSAMVRCSVGSFTSPPIGQLGQSISADRGNSGPSCQSCLVCFWELAGCNGRSLLCGWIVYPLESSNKSMSSARLSEKGRKSWRLSLRTTCRPSGLSSPGWLG